LCKFYIIFAYHETCPIRASLAAAKYPFKVSTEAVRNVLQKLKTGPAPQITVEQAGDEIRYSLAKAPQLQEA